MFIIYHGRFPSEKAAALFVAKSTEAFASEGLDVAVLAPKRLRRSGESFSRYYGIQNNFTTVFLPTLDLFHNFGLKVSAFRISSLIFSLSCLGYLLFHAKREDIIYSNETFSIFLLSFFYPNTFYELHDFPEKNLLFHKALLRKMRWVLVHKKWKTEALVERFGVKKDNIIYEINAVDFTDFDIALSKEEARKKLALHQDVFLVVYTGHLYDWKGVDVLAGAAALLSEKFLVVFVGGTEPDIESFAKKYGMHKNILIAGYRSHSEIPIWQKAADVLILPNTAKDKLSMLYTSPMKLFEYMASKRLIIASKIPSVTEILNDKNSILVPPDNTEALAEAIQKAQKGIFPATDLAKRAFEDVQNHSWSKRAKRILDFIYQS